ncbi:MAG: SsrA-binding protein SmpB [Erysipelotrichaceae bacterium]|nr:SsrA-binding protein SmpB [Erysipelotrichaceae bacterium]MBQ1787628.1 SsrA-binding protein SmpB [Erysipelotrichaceae bacterium]MBQ5805343.1 SsrA-binding protein SmpB [Erysipelotrichaceae bacterium]
MKDIAVNKKAYHDYFIEDRYEAGMVLLGTEIKSVRMGKVSMKEAYVSFTNGEAFVKDLHIAQYKEATYNNHDETRDRKLLLHKREIDKLSSKVKLQGYTCIPLRMYFSNGRVKLEIALAKGKTLYDKRESDKKRSMERQASAGIRR